MWPSASASAGRSAGDPAAVVGDLELEPSPRGGSRPRPRSRPSAGPRCRAARGQTASSELVLAAERLGVEVDLDLEPALARRLARDRAERLLEAALLEGHRVQRHHRLAQARDRRLDHLVRALHLSPPGRGLDQLLVGGEQGLQRVVVDQLGDPPPALILGVHHLGDELAARVELLAQVGDLGPQPLVLGPGRPARRAVRHYSSIPRRIASATAAARSETPSFS